MAGRFIPYTRFSESGGEPLSGFFLNSDTIAELAPHPNGTLIHSSVGRQLVIAIEPPEHFTGEAPASLGKKDQKALDAANKDNEALRNEVAMLTKEKEVLTEQVADLNKQLEAATAPKPADPTPPA